MGEDASKRISKRLVAWRRLGLEFVVIVVGVLAALAADQWAQARADERLAEEVLRRLAIELNENREQIERRLAYHGTVVPRLDSLRVRAEAGQRTGLTRSSVLPQGLGFYWLRETAWETAVVTEAVRHFELDVTVVLSDTYSLLQQVRQAERIAEQGVVRPESFASDDQRGTVIFLSTIMHEVLDLERSLFALTEKALEEIRSRVPDLDLESPVDISRRPGQDDAYASGG